MAKNDEIYTIDAVYIRESTNSVLFNCEGDLIWLPKKHITYNKEKSEVRAPLWLLKSKFPEEF